MRQRAQSEGDIDRPAEDFGQNRAAQDGDGPSLPRGVNVAPSCTKQEHWGFRADVVRGVQDRADHRSLGFGAHEYQTHTNVTEGDLGGVDGRHPKETQIRPPQKGIEKIVRV